MEWKFFYVSTFWNLKCNQNIWFFNTCFQMESAITMHLFWEGLRNAYVTITRNVGDCHQEWKVPFYLGINIAGLPKSEQRRNRTDLLWRDSRLRIMNIWNRFSCMQDIVQYWPACKQIIIHYVQFNQASVNPFVFTNQFELFITTVITTIFSVIVAMRSIKYRRGGHQI